MTNSSPAANTVETSGDVHAWIYVGRGHVSPFQEMNETPSSG